MQVSSFFPTGLFRSILLLLLSFSLVLLQGRFFSLSLAQQTPSTSQERILNYQSEILVKEDASLRVAERITVQVTAQETQRQLYRELSLAAPFRAGQVSVKVIDVLRNGESISHSLVEQGNKKRINIYRDQVEIDPGIYTFTIEYTTDQRLDFSDPQFDRLSWNVTGEGWQFPIDQVRAKVLLPDGISGDRLQFTASITGETDQEDDYQARLDAGGNPTFVTTERLAVGEGLELTVTFPKGYVERPHPLKILYWQITHFLEEAMPSFLKIILAVLIVCFIFILIPLWFWFGRPSNFFE
jgi:hypothetical protein